MADAHQSGIHPKPLWYVHDDVPERGDGLREQHDLGRNTGPLPKLKIHVAESGGSWIPHLLKHMTWATEFSVLTKAGWPDPACTPLDLLKRTFVFSTLELELAVELGEKYGMEGWMIEDDYPHCESVWPNTKKHFGEVLGSLDSDSFERFAWKNASELFRHPVPAGGFINNPELKSA